MNDPREDSPYSPPHATDWPAPFNDDDGPPVILKPLGGQCPWGPWATLGWTALALFVMIVIQNVVAIGFVVAGMAAGRMPKIADLTTGNLIAAATLLSTPAVVALVGLFVYIRRCSLRDYLALRWPRMRASLLSIAGLIIFLAATDTFTYVLGRPVVPPVMVTAYKSSWPPLLVFAVLIAAPLGEETLMRGFLFRGIAASRWGPVAAVLISSLIWSVVHVQYDLFTIGTVFVLGLYLGFVRHRTGSVPLTMLLHGIGNAIATAELIIQVEWLAR